MTMRQAWKSGTSDPGPGAVGPGVGPSPQTVALAPPLEGAPKTAREAIRVGPWAPILVLILAAAVYVDGLSYQFVWDDGPMVVQNPELRDLRNLPRFLRADYTTLTSGAIDGHYYRPILALSLALDGTLWGLNPAAFHLTNILLHLVVTLLLGRFLLALGAAREIAVLAALIFAIHPAHVEVVAFVAARVDLLLTLCILGCALSYSRSKTPGRGRTAWTLAALALQVLALLSKETAVTLPALLVLSDRLGSFTRTGQTSRGGWSGALIRSLPFWAVTAVFVALRFNTVLYIGGDRLHAGTLWHRLPGSLEILARYVGLSLLPARMQPFYDLPRPASFLAPWPILGILAGIGLLILLLWCWRRVPLAAFGVGWFTITVIPVTDLVPVSFREMGLADRYLYLPSVGVSILLALALTRLMGRAAEGASLVRRTVGWLALILLLISYPYHLLRYAPVWRDNLSLYGRMEEVAPHSPHPPLNLGLVYFEANDLPRATAAMERAVRLGPDLRRARATLALLYVLQGRAAEGFSLFDDLASDPLPDRSYYVARSKAHLFMGEARQALAVLEEGMRRYPDRGDFTFWSGRALEDAGRPAEAMERYREATRLGPDAPLAEEALANLLARSGRLAEAARHYLRAMALMPDRVQPVRSLARLMEAAGNPSESLRLWRRVLEMAPNGAAIREAAASIRRLEKRVGEAGVSSDDSLAPEIRKS